MTYFIPNTAWRCFTIYSLDDATKINPEFPDTSFIPTAQEKENLQKNDTVKLIFRENSSVERTWVNITQTPVKKGTLLFFIGVLDNAPFELNSIKLGDTVNFNENHIVDIFSPK